MLTPLFVPGRIRTAIPIMNNVTKSLAEYIEGGPESSTMEFDVKEVCEASHSQAIEVSSLLCFSWRLNSQLTLLQQLLLELTARVSRIQTQSFAKLVTMSLSQLFGLE